ncbi:MAG: S8 family serine peptidase [Planctomycetes bacterium]|nr:S8 family serine peptidase [Planctomycetota bacterium]
MSRRSSSQLNVLITLSLLIVSALACVGGGGGGDSTSNAAAVGGGGGSGNGGSATISGTIRVPGERRPYSSLLVQDEGKDSEVEAEPEYREGEFVATVNQGYTINELMKFCGSEYSGISFVQTRTYGARGPFLIVYSSADGVTPPKTLEVIARLRNASVIEAVSPNYFQRSQQAPSSSERIPNDTLYATQWHYGMIDLPRAWKEETGQPSVIVAVLDTGVLTNHPDLSANLTSTGYDFVSDAQNSGDGNGIDSDPSDPILSNPKIPQSFHGSHVAGTIAAVSNNSQGVAGIAWGCKVMPVRVLGGAGGADTDIWDGMLYAASLANASGTVPAKKADIINMSLGGSSTDTASETQWQSIVDQVWAAGVTIVAAAGNDNTSTRSIPAALNHVIAVSAVDRNAQKSEFSNFGSWIDVAAPGGGGSLDFFLSDGNRAYEVEKDVVSSVRTSGIYWYIGMPGTSMASPHVAGVAALIKSAAPNLTPDQIEQILKNTATDLGSPGRDDLFGDGLIDAFQAVLSAKGLTPSFSALRIVPEVTSGVSAISFAEGVSSLEVKLVSTGATQISGLSAIDQEASGGNWLTTSLDTTTTPAKLTATVSRTGLSDGLYAALITVSDSSGSSRPVLCTMQVSAITIPDIGSLDVYLFDDSNPDNPVATTTTNRASQYRYTFSSVAAGNYLIVAGSDNVDNDGNPGSAIGEFLGFLGYDSPDLVPVSDGATVNGKHFAVEQIGRDTIPPGTGGGAINNAIIAQVVDDVTYKPIVGANVYLGNGTLSAQTDEEGIATLVGNFSGAQTISATATGFSTTTFLNLNASQVRFELCETNPTKYQVAVTVSGLNPTTDKSVLVSANGEWSSANYNGTSNPTVNLQIQQGAQFSISVFSRDASGATTAASIDESTYLNSPISAAGSVVVDFATQSVSLVTVSGAITPPAGGVFDMTTAPTYLGFGYHYYDYTRGDGFAGLDASVANPSAFSFKTMAFPNSSRYGLAFGAISASGQTSILQLIAPYSSLSSSYTAALHDVPALSQPAASASVATSALTFSWTNSSSADLGTLEIKDATTPVNTVWEVNFPGTTTSFTLPSIPTGGLSSGSSYKWDITNGFVPNFDYNNFNFPDVDQAFTGLTTSSSRGFTVQ